jgi:hypothetical protein
MTNLTAHQVAAVHGCHIRTVRRALRAGDLPGAYKVGEGSRAVWVIPRTAAEQWRPRKVGRPRTKNND